MIQRQDKYGNTSTDLGPVLVYDKYGKLKKIGGSGGSGTQGPQGPAGGPQGPQGAQGFQGRQGVQGERGDQGYQGDQGDQGAQGVQGDIGAQGVQGDIGPQGRQGTQGNQGVQGTQGAQGALGPQGAQGTQGNQGVQGTQGVQGALGPQGAQGTQGNQGVQGTQGNQGVQGDQGNNGISAGAIYYFNQSQPSDVSPYRVLSTQPNGPQQIVTTNLAGSQQNVVVSEFLTPQLGFAVIPGGTQRFHFHFLKQASNDSIETYATIQLANSSGVAIGPVIQTGTSLIGWVDASTPVEVTLDLTLSTTAIDPTNRMIVRIYLMNNDSNAHIVNWYTEGNQYYAFVLTSVGVVGNQGVTGPQGAQGAQGVAGAQGTEGTQGVAGAQGAQGTQGVAGAQGTQGTQGVAGAQGTQGTQGVAGAQGTQGTQGVAGAQGTQGVAGVQGTQGVAGAQGAQGTQGFQGNQGPGASIVASDYVMKAVKGGSAQTILNNNNNQVITFVDDFDPQNWWTSDKFQPTIAGYYNLQLAVWWDAGAITNNQTNIQLQKNGTTQIAIQQTQIVTGAGYGQEIDTIAYFNGTTDYVEATAYTGNTTSQNINGTSTGTWFTAALITNGTGPQGVQGPTGSGGGAGGTDLGLVQAMTQGLQNIF